ncbi:MULTISPECIES: sensor domain-containing diguanylate cyclase [unclassified Sphingomonas]|uniref:diguanylate cyclase n=1 Tax=Sphingomonas sp. GC_Shp_1 TaxID=2937385 RepID=UPI00226A4295
MFEQALDVLPDGVLMTDSHRKMVYCNSAFLKHWGIPATMVANGDDIALLDYVREQVVDPTAFIGEVERINPTLETSQDEVHLKDGRVLSRRSVPFDENGTFAARLWIFSDVTEARYAHIDALCGIPNRRAYSMRFPEFVEAADDGLVRSVGLIDIDNFKAYNDSYGHAAGDIVLRQIGNLLRRRSAKLDDMVFRIGGEEFLMAYKSRDAPGAVSFFEALRADVENMRVPHEKNTPHNVVTASIGLSVFRGPKIPAELFDDVDAALYRSKHRGRNMVTEAA